MSRTIPSAAADAKAQRFRGVEQGLLVFLHILGIGQWQSLHDAQQRDGRADDTPGLGPDQLRRVPGCASAA